MGKSFVKNTPVLSLDDRASLVARSWEGPMRLTNQLEERAFPTANFQGLPPSQQRIFKRPDLVNAALPRGSSEPYLRLANGELFPVNILPREPTLQGASTNGQNARGAISFRNTRSFAPFLGFSTALALSLRNLGLEVGGLVLYYSFARVASHPMAPSLFISCLSVPNESF